MVSASPEPTASSGGGGARVRDGMEALAAGKSILGGAIIEAPVTLGTRRLMNCTGTRRLRPCGGCLRMRLSILTRGAQASIPKIFPESRQ